MVSQQLISMGVIVIFIGVFLVLLGALTGMQKGESKAAVGGFIGFIPFGFANDKKLLYAAAALTLLLFLLSISARLFYK